MKSTIFKGNFFTAIAVTLLVFLIVGAVPLFSAFGAFLVPIPILYYYSKNGRMEGICVFAASLLFVSIVLHILKLPTPVIYFVLLGFLGAVLSEVLRKSYSIEKTVLVSTGMFLAVSLGFILYFSISSGEGPWDMLEAFVGQVVQSNIDAYAQWGADPDQIELLRKHADSIAKMLANVFPSFAAVSVSFVVLLNILEGKVLFKKSGLWYPDFGNLSYWKAHDKTVWLIISAAGCVLIPLEFVKYLGLNILIIMLFIYLMQGLSIINYFFDRKQISFLFRFLGYFLIFVQQIMLILVIALGLIDVWADFRKLRQMK